MIYFFLVTQNYSRNRKFFSSFHKSINRYELYISLSQHYKQKTFSNLNDTTMIAIDIIVGFGNAKNTKCFVLFDWCINFLEFLTELQKEFVFKILLQPI
ncbi:hypothetical protein OBPA_22910 [Polaribacter sp. OB-PA-B3]